MKILKYKDNEDTEEELKVCLIYIVTFLYYFMNTYADNSFMHYFTFTDMFEATRAPPPRH